MIEHGQSESVHETQWVGHFEKLSSFRDLKDGWNGYRAPAPNQTAIANARDFLEVMQEYGYLPTRLAPSAVGGVGVTRRTGSRKVYVEFFNNSLISALFADDATKTMDTRKVNSTPEDYGNLISDIEDYLNG